MSRVSEESQSPLPIPPRSQSRLSARTTSSRNSKSSSQGTIDLNNHVRDLKNRLAQVQSMLDLAVIDEEPPETIKFLRRQVVAVQLDLRQAENERENFLANLDALARSFSPSRLRSSTPPLETAYIDMPLSPDDAGKVGDSEERTVEAEFAADARNLEEDPPLLHIHPVSTPSHEYNGSHSHTPVRDDYTLHVDAAVSNLSAPRRPNETLRDYQRRRNALGRLQTPSRPLFPQGDSPSRHERTVPPHVDDNGVLADTEIGRTRIIEEPEPGTTPQLHPAAFTPQSRPRRRRRPAQGDHSRPSASRRTFLVPPTPGKTAETENVKNEDSHSPNLQGHGSGPLSQPPVPPVPSGDGSSDPSDDDGNGHGGGEPHRDRSHHGSRQGDSPPRSQGGRPPQPPGDDPPDPSNGDNHSHRSASSHNLRRPSPHYTVNDRRTPFGVIPPGNERLPGQEFFDYQALDYDSSIPLRDRVFATFANRIEYKLHQKRNTINDAKSRKELVNSMQKLVPYDGDSNIAVLDTFLRGLIERFRVLGLTGPPHIQNRAGVWVITDEDANRVVLLGANLSGTAKSWFDDIVDEVPSSYLFGSDARQHDYSFIEVFRGLFNRFILQDALHDLKRVFKSITYSSEGGARRLFADLHLCAKRMPEPPSLNKFKVALIRRLPDAMRTQIANAGITADDNSVNDIMQKALSLEKGWNANKFYSSSTATTVHMRANAERRKQTMPNDKKEPAPSQKSPAGSSDPPRRIRFTTKQKDGACYACGEKGHFINDPQCKAYRDGGPRLAAVLEENPSSGSSSEGLDPYREELFSDEFIDAIFDAETNIETYGAIGERISVYDDGEYTDYQSPWDD
ncbi:hypothetical protein VNI00_009836 [Paramarasmius palmivorus]|uniref:Uncharacterized protein n=1 Tax=Paramarasmius palmivorus TaxID=297713 RepID=A0AAW0CKC4_9AGAR